MKSRRNPLGDNVNRRTTDLEEANSIGQLRKNFKNNLRRDLQAANKKRRLIRNFKNNLRRNPPADNVNRRKEKNMANNFGRDHDKSLRRDSNTFHTIKPVLVRSRNRRNSIPTTIKNITESTTIVSTTISISLTSKTIAEI